VTDLCKHELLPEWCASCSPMPRADVEALNAGSSPGLWRQHQADLFSAPAERPHTPFPASYTSECGICDGAIFEGDLITRDNEHGYVHAECLEY
jgi:hypothetical protein